MKDLYRDQTGLDVYSEKGSYSDHYVHWLEKKLESFNNSGKVVGIIGAGANPEALSKAIECQSEALKPVTILIDSSVSVGVKLREACEKSSISLEALTCSLVDLKVNSKINKSPEDRFRRHHANKSKW